MKNQLILLLLFFTPLIMSVSCQITGTVIDISDNRYLPGVNIIIKGTNTGVITDNKGEFTIEANIGDTLVFSFIGMQTETICVSKTKMQVSLIPTLEMLSEIIVIGYGEIKKKDLTGSVSVIGGDELLKQPALTVSSALQGVMPGVQVVNSSIPGKSPMVRIKGVGTILGGADPLYIVDGTITNDISAINIADIERVDVLKDASSAAIYGARAANGVIIITTKKGETHKPVLTYDGYTGYRQITNRVEMADESLYAQYTNEALEYDGFNPYYNMDSLPGYNTNWLDEISRKGFIQNHTLSLNGGNESNTYYISLNYYNEDGVLKTNDFKRYILRLNNLYSINKYLSLGTNMSIAHSTIQNMPYAVFKGDNQDFSIFNDAYRQAPTIPAWDENGNYGFSGTLNNVGNPVAVIDYMNTRARVNQLTGNAYLDIKPFRNFVYRFNYGLETKNTAFLEYFPEFHATPSQYNDISKLTKYNTSFTRQLLDNTLNYTINSGIHSLVIMTGMTTENIKSEYIVGSRQHVPKESNYWYLNTGTETTATNSNGGDKETRLSYIGRTTYSISDKYLLTATCRADGSSKFPSQNRWGFFPSASVGWRISNESFMSGHSWLRNLKLRASWGKIGNDQIGSNEFIQTIGSNLNYVLGEDQAVVPGATIVDIKDEHLQWEVTEEYVVGLDYTLFDGKLSGEMDVYNKLTSNALIQAPIDAIFGDADGLFLTNKADIRNRGAEFQISWKYQKSDFSSVTGFTGTYNENTIEHVGEAIPIESGSLGNGQLTTRTEEGQPIGSFFLYETDGIFNTQKEIDDYIYNGELIQPDSRPGDLKFKDNNNDGQITEDDKIFAGSYQPKFYFGFNLSIEFKQFDLSMYWYGNTGNKIYNGKKAQRWGGENIEASLSDRWTENNTGSDIPRASNEVPVASTYYLEDGNFIKLSSMSIGYSLPSIIAGKIGTEKLRFYLMCLNPLTFKKFSGYNPELPAGTLNSGIELNAYPTTASFLIGFDVNF